MVWETVGGYGAWQKLNFRKSEELQLKKAIFCDDTLFF